MKQKAILYIRVSTDEQAEKGYSLKHQQERLDRYCEFNGIEIVATYQDDHSAKTFERPQFQNLLASLKKRREAASLLLFTKWDRFSRNAGDAYGMINQLRKLGVDPQAIEQPLDLNIPENKIMLAFYLAAPEVENDRRALNTLVGMRRARKEGRWLTTAPKGYRNCRNEANQPIIEPNKDAPLVRLAFEELSKGLLDIEAVRRLVNSKGLKVSRSAFWYLVRNPMYCGKLFVPAWKDEEAIYVKGIHEPLITEALFEEVQDILSGRKKNVPVKNTRHEALPLRGYLACSRCGRPLTGSASHGNGGKYYYYHCQASLGCKERFKAPEANASFINFLATFSAKEEVLELYSLIIEERFKKAKATKSTESKDTQAKIEKLNTRLKNAKEMMLDGEMDRSEYKEIKAELEPEIERLRKAQTTTNTLEDDYKQYGRKGLSILKNLAIIYASADLQRKQQIQGAIFPEKLVYSENNYRTKTPHPLFEVITTTEAAFSGNKKRKGQHFANLSCQVEARRIKSNLYSGLYAIEAFLNKW
jgi:DNA invertase Pin-like site-specific DNA recombinase